MAEKAADLVEEVYAVTIDPTRYDQLMRVWEGYIEAQVQALEAKGQGVSSDKLLERHVKTALKIFDQIGRNRRTKKSAEAFLAGLPVAAMIVNERFAVRACQTVGDGGMICLLGLKSEACSVSEAHNDPSDIGGNGCASWFSFGFLAMMVV